MPLVQKDYYSTQEALERVRLALPLEDAEQNLIEVLALGKCTAWFINQAGERFDIPTELWEALLNHRSIDRTYNVLNVDWETGEVLCLGRYEGDSDSIASRGHRGLLRFDCGQLDSVVKPSHSWELLDGPRPSYPGRPSFMHLIQKQMRKRHESGKMCDTLAEEARYLETWASDLEDPPAQPPKVGAIQNSIRQLYRELKPVASLPIPKGEFTK